jgi:hypothetical protein
MGVATNPNDCFAYVSSIYPSIHPSTYLVMTSSNAFESEKSPTRRVVKAKQPPPPLELSPQAAAAAASKHDEKENTDHSAYSNFHSPFQTREQEEEWAQRTRDHRFDVSAKLQKEHKQVFVQSKRTSATSIPTTPIEKPADTNVMEIPPSMSVEPKYPEHKRTTQHDDEEAESSGVGGWFTGKRYKKARLPDEEVEEDIEGNVDDSGEGSGSPFEKDFWLGWKGAAVVAVVGVVAFALLSTSRPPKRR